MGFTWGSHGVHMVHQVEWEWAVHLGREHGGVLKVGLHQKGFVHRYTIRQLRGEGERTGLQDPHLRVVALTAKPNS